MPERQILYFDIADRQLELRDSVAPDDFVLLRRDTPHEQPADALAYCVDLQAERVLYTLHAQPHAVLLAAPFLYRTQLISAQGVVSVPFERLDQVSAAAAEGLHPTLIFSPGRTGSTLLARLLAACGTPCASEPDMPTQICRFEREDRQRIGLDMEVALQRAGLRSLCRVLGGSPFIKLRSQCNARPMPLLQAMPGASVIFILRQRADWALSRHRAFAEPAESVASVLRQAIDALDKLSGVDCDLRVVWFESLVTDAATEMARLLPNGASDVNASAIAATMTQDAQAGTAVERARLVGAQIDDGFADAFEVAWIAAREGADWGDTTRACVIQMDQGRGTG